MQMCLSNVRWACISPSNAAGDFSRDALQVKPIPKRVTLGSSCGGRPLGLEPAGPVHLMVECCSSTFT